MDEWDVLIKEQEDADSDQPANANEINVLPRERRPGCTAYAMP
jgi:hypothetical protein